MALKSYCLFVVVVICCGLLGRQPVLAQAASTDDRDYARVIADALREFDAGHFEEARALFLHANELRPSARTMRALGFAEFELRHYVAADRWLHAALIDSRNPLTSAQREDVDKALARIRSFVGRYRLQCDPAPATFKLDGQDATPDADGALLLEVGEHVLTASAPGYASASEHIDVRGGEDTLLRIALAPAAGAPAVGAPAATPARARGGSANALPWALIIGGSSLGVGGVVLFALGRDAASSVEDAKDGATYASIRSAQSRAPLLSNLGIALAGVGLATAGVGIVLLSQRKSGERAAVATQLAISPAGVRVSGAF